MRLRCVKLVLAGHHIGPQPHTRTNLPSPSLRRLYSDVPANSENIYRHETRAFVSSAHVLDASVHARDWKVELTRDRCVMATRFTAPREVLLAPR